MKHGSDPSWLSRHDFLLYSIGRVAQAHVSLEVTLRGLWTAIAHLQGRLGELDLTAGFSDIVVQTQRDLVRLSGVPDAIKTAARPVFQELTEVNRLRNRVVHDHWIDLSGVVEYRSGNPATDESAWLRADLRTGVAELRADLSTQAYVDDCLVLLERSHQAVSDVTQLLWHFVPVLKGGAPSRTVEDLLERLKRPVPAA